MSGVRNWEDMNAWRMILLYAAPWLTVCSLWVGITRRITVLGLLSVLAVDGAVLARGHCRACESRQRPDASPYPQGPANNLVVSAFVYKNHAGAYFNLMLAVSLALACWHFSRSARRAERANPVPILFPLCGLGRVDDAPHPFPRRHDSALCFFVGGGRLGYRAGRVLRGGGSQSGPARFVCGLAGGQRRGGRLFS